jgi:hypothetical protein
MGFSEVFPMSDLAYSRIVVEFLFANPDLVPGEMIESLETTILASNPVLGTGPLALYVASRVISRESLTADEAEDALQDFHDTDGQEF